MSGSLENLNVSDLLRIDNEIKKPLMADYRKRQLRQKKMLLIGMLYSLMGVMLLLMIEMIDSLKYEAFSVMALVITFFGLIVSMFSLLAPNSKIIGSNSEIIKRKSEDNRRIL